MGFIDSIKERAKSNLKTIVLPESMDRRIFEAAEIVLKENIANLIIIGTDEIIAKNSKGLDISGATIVNPYEYYKTQDYIDVFYELRKSKGMTPEQAKDLVMNDYMYYACMMVKFGDADGVVSGACHSTAETLKPSLQIIKAKPGTKMVSGFFVMCVPDCEFGSNGNFVFADAGLNQNPNPEELAAITDSSAKSFEMLVGEKPICALLSHSTKGSAKHPDVTKVTDAVAIIKKNYPHIVADGELQLDAALVPEVAKFKAPGSTVAGNANVLIFPDLDAANIGYKLVERLGKAEAYGPLTQGMAKPINDLSRGCSPRDIVGVIAITAVQAQNRKLL